MKYSPPILHILHTTCIIIYMYITLIFAVCTLLLENGVGITIVSLVPVLTNNIPSTKGNIMGIWEGGTHTLFKDCSRRPSSDSGQFRQPVAIFGWTRDSRIHHKSTVRWGTPIISHLSSLISHLSSITYHLSAGLRRRCHWGFLELLSTWWAYRKAAVKTAARLGTAEVTQRGNLAEEPQAPSKALANLSWIYLFEKPSERLLHNYYYYY